MALFRPRFGAMLTVAFDGRGAPNKVVTVDHVLPREMTVVRNGYHEADTWSAEFDMRTMPFDPEGIAWITAQLYIWADDGTAGKEWASPANKMIEGIADEDSIELDKSRQRLVMSGRDYTGILDPEWDSRKPLPSGIPLDRAVQFLANSAKPAIASAAFTVVWKSSDSIPIVGATARSTKKKGLWVKPGKTTWDCIYDLVLGHGYICFVQDRQIVIADPRTLLEENVSQTPRVAYGRELSSLKVHRKLARERVPRIKLNYYDAKARQRFDVIFPDKAPLTTTAINGRPVDTIGAGLKANEDLVMSAPPYCHDRDSALRAAKNRWELMARGESTYTFSTRYMSVPQGEVAAILGKQLGGSFGSNEFDLLSLQTGDPIAIVFDPFNLEQMRSLDYGQRVAFLEGLGYTEKLAAFVANSVERIDQFRQAYYVRKATYEYEHTDGLTIEVEAVNFAFERREIQWADDEVPANVDAVSGDSLPSSVGSTS